MVFVRVYNTNIHRQHIDKYVYSNYLYETNVTCFFNMFFTARYLPYVHKD